MKLENALKRLKKAGYKIGTNGIFYSAFLDGHEITFTAHNEKTSKFSSGFPKHNSCIYGLSLKQAMS